VTLSAGDWLYPDEIVMLTMVIVIDQRCSCSRSRLWSMRSLQCSARFVACMTHVDYEPTDQPTIHPSSLARTTQGAQLSENHDSAQRLCLVLEKALMFEIRDGIFSRSFFWDYVVNLDQCVPGCKRALNLIKDKATTSAGTRAARSSSERDTGDIRSMMT